MRVKDKIRVLFIMAIVLVGMASVGNKTEVSAATKSLTTTQVVDYCNKQVGKSYPSGQCLKWVADTWKALGGTRSSSCCAYNYGSSHIQSRSISNIPVGADVFFGNCAKGPCKTCKSTYYGHVGIYVGGDKFVHATGGRVQITSLTKTSWKNKYRGWGYHSNIAITNAGKTSVQVKKTTYSIDNVKVSYCDSSKITITWSTTNLKRSCVVVTAANQTWRSSYAIGSSFSATFDRSSIKNCPSTVQIRIYGYSNTSGAGQNETVHLVTYNSSSGYVAFPEKQTLYCSDSVPSNMLAKGIFSGWVISDTSPIANVRVTVNGTTLSAPLINRADVKRVYPAYKYVKGYSLQISPYYVRDGVNSYSVTATLQNGRVYTIKSGSFTAQKVNCIFDPVFFRMRYADTSALKNMTNAQLEKYFYDNLNKKIDGEYLSGSMVYCPSYYVKVNSDLNVKWSGEEIYSHYVNFAIKSGKEYRSISPWVSLYYLHTKYADLKNMSPEALLNWVATWGLKIDQRLLSNTPQAKAFNKFYRCQDYASRNSDLVRAFSKPVMVADFAKTKADDYWYHLWNWGIAEKRTTSNNFNVGTYMKNAGLSGSTSVWQVFNHYCNVGYTRGIKTK